MLASEVFEHIQADLEGPLASEHDKFLVLNYAAEAMEAAREWRYLRRTRGDLKFRAPISVSDASFVGTTGTLSKAGLFADYTLVPGDFVTLTLNGTAFGDFNIVSRVDDDSITVEDSTTASTFAGTAAADVNTARVALPSDVGSIVAVFGDYNGRAFPMSYMDIAQRDSETLTTTTLAFYYATEWRTLTTFSAPELVLKVWPEQQSAELNAARVVYLRKWVRVTSTDSILPIPPHMEPLLLEYAKAYARGWDESGDVGVNLAQIEMGYQYKAACRADARNGSHNGPMKNTAIQSVATLDPQKRPAETYFPSLHN